MRRFILSLILCAAVGAGGLTGCYARAPGAGGACYGTPAGNAIAQAFAGSPVVDYMEHVAWRESRCDPGARNPSGASGALQIMLPLHHDLFAALAWRGCWPYGFSLWQDPGCNAYAARELYDSSGISPWRL